MSLTELKDTLYQAIADTDDAELLRLMLAFMYAETEEADFWANLSDSDKLAIEEGLKQLQSGEGIPHEIMRKKYEKWL